MSEGFGELVLILGDLHIPHRAAAIPAPLKKMLVPERMQHILCTGNACTKGVLEYLKTIAPNVHAVKGDFDEIDGLVEERVVQIGQFKIGICHGHTVVPWGDLDSLAVVRRKLDVDILVTGHTHKSQVIEHDGAYFINPGSITGAFDGINSRVTPSFILMSIKKSKVIVYVYELPPGAKKPTVAKTEFSKK